MTVDELHQLIASLKKGPRNDWPWELITELTNLMAKKILADNK
jgi:hypothetical protein